MGKVEIVPTASRENTAGTIAVVYARYSSHTQGEQSIDGQLAAARTYAAAKGYTIVHEYIDRAMTGRNDDREAFQQMLSDCGKHSFQIIIVWKVDRFGRNREEITFNKHRCRKHGVRVEYVAETMPDGPEGVILESVLEGMAEYYSLQLSQNIRRGTRENAKRCRFTGGRVPLGYTLTSDHEFRIDPETAPIVRRIFEAYAAGTSMAEIARGLTADGLRTKLGTPFTTNSIRSVLTNEKYIGVYDFKDGEIRVEDGVPAIVDRQTFEKVRNALRRATTPAAARWRRADYLLTGKLFCGACGALMAGESGTSKTGAKHGYYLCSHHKHRKGCKAKAVRQDWLEEYVLDTVRDLVMDDETIQSITDLVWNYYSANMRTEDRKTTLEAQIRDLDAAERNILRAVEAGLPVTEQTKSRLSELDAQRTALQTALAEVKYDDRLHLTRDHIEFFLLQFRDGDWTDREWQRRVIDTFVNSIYVTDDDLLINLNYGGAQTQIKLEDAQKARVGGFEPRALCSTKKAGCRSIPLFWCKQWRGSKGAE